MKKIVLYLFLLFQACILTEIYASSQTIALPSNELPSEQTLKRINDLSQSSQDQPSFRAGGPPGSDTGGGGAVGTPTGNVSILHVITFLTIYISYCIIKNRRKNSEY